jgi:RNA methyltransferase, TrmH family
VPTVPLITSTANAAVKAARKLARSHGREPGGAFLVEGPQSVREAVRGGLLQLFVTDEAESRQAEVIAAARAAGAEILPVSPAVLASLATTVTPQGLVGVARLPAAGLDSVLDRAGLVVVCHEIRDPGNLGTVIRTADAAGADAVLLTGDSVDARNPKAVRASAGSLFHLPVVAPCGWDDVVNGCRVRGVRLVAADARGGTGHTDADLSAPVALVLGNEAWGLPATVLGDCDAVVAVAMHPGGRAGYGGAAESLNLAATAAVVLFEAVRQARAAAGGAR